MPLVRTKFCGSSTREAALKASAEEVLAFLGEPRYCVDSVFGGSLQDRIGSGKLPRYQMARDARVPRVVGVPGGAIGVRLKSKAPLSFGGAERLNSKASE